MDRGTNAPTFVYPCGEQRIRPAPRIEFWNISIPEPALGSARRLYTYKKGDPQRTLKYNLLLLALIYNYRFQRLKGPLASPSEIRDKEYSGHQVIGLVGLSSLLLQNSK